MRLLEGTHDDRRRLRDSRGQRASSTRRIGDRVDHPQSLASSPTRRSASGARCRPVRAPAAGRAASATTRTSATSSSSRRRRWAPAARRIISPTSATRRSARDVNVGAGTITCNYDGGAKHQTVDRGRRVHRQRLDARRAGDRRPERLCRRRIDDHRRRAGRRARHRARPPGKQAGWVEKRRTESSSSR